MMTRSFTIAVFALISVSAAQEDIVRRQASSSFAEIDSRLFAAENVQSNLVPINELGETRVEMTSRAADAAMDVFVQTTAQIQQVANSITSDSSGELSTRMSLMTEIDELESTNAEMQSTVNELSSTLAGVPSQLAAVSTSVAAISADGSVLERVNTTYLRDSRIPVFKWQFWHTYSNSFSWIDGNNGNGFAGVTPSTWTDGNGRAYQMTNNWNTLNRLFIRKGTASNYGATVCAETRMYYSSTDGSACGALFRIRNPTNSLITWRPSVYMTSYTGWSETASISVNRQNTWSSNCQGGCTHTPSLPMPANRISTVAFISTASGVAGGSASFHQRSTVLQFRDNSLQLPSGLQFVDDFDTLTGVWS